MPIHSAYIVPHPPILVPAVGRGQERAVAATAGAMRGVAARIEAARPETVILLSPHAVLYADYIHIAPGRGGRGSLARFGDPAPVEVEYDEVFVRALSARCEEVGFPAGTQGERDSALDHGALVPLHFLRRACGGGRFVRVSLSGLTREEHYRFGMLLRETAEEIGRDAVLIASGDLSHKLREDGPYGFAPEGPRLDGELTAAMRTGDFGRWLSLPEALHRAGADCGLQGFVILAGAFDRRAVRPELLSYEGPLGVGYAVAAFEDVGPDPDRALLERHRARRADTVRALRGEESPHVRLARAALETHVRTGGLPPLPGDLPQALVKERAGAFVSLKIDGSLRGCIGTTAPTRGCLAEEIRQNAVSAGTQDPRFPPVREEELDAVVYSVDVLSPAVPCTREELDPRRFGVVVCRGRRRGLLLPDLEGVDTVEEQVAIALDKAGIGPDETYTLERFEVVRFT